jgi:hypothetical protein
MNCPQKWLVINAKAEFNNVPPAGLWGILSRDVDGEIV